MARLPSLVMARNLLWILLALIACAALAFAAAPVFAFRALAAAARDGDAQALAELIDYAAVRASLRPQLALQARAAAPPPPPDIWSDPIGAVRRAIEPLQPAPPAVERYVAAPGLHDLTRGYEPGKAPAGAADATLPGLRYWGPNRVRFAARAQGAGPDSTVVFTFQRRGPFAWKLVHIGLPT
jgi:hypothetical protein